MTEGPTVVSGHLRRIQLSTTNVISVLQIVLDEIQNAQVCSDMNSTLASITRIGFERASVEIESKANGRSIRCRRPSS